MTRVYLLRSLVGPTEHLEERWAQHDSPEGQGCTAKYRPWKIEVAIRFADRLKAKAFEERLESGSGHAFANRHFG